MSASKRDPVRFSLLTVLIWLLVAAGVIYLLWQVITRISANNIPVSTAAPNQTQIYQTIAAILTPQSTIPVVTSTQAETPTPVSNLTLTPAASMPSPQLTSTLRTAIYTSTPGVPCDHASAGNPLDLTIPDDSLIPAGQNFIKTWKLVNSGSCTWTSSYSASFFYGDRMSAPQLIPLKETVLPSQSVEISVEMISPMEPGTYQGNWKLANPAGELFGIGPNGDAAFWVRIIVPIGQSSTPSPTLGATGSPTMTPTPGATASPTATVTPTPTATATPSFTPTPPIQASGERTLLPNDTIDLDSLTINAEDHDLNYTVDSNQYHWLAPQGEVKIGVFGSHDPGLSDCQSASMSSAPIAVDGLPLDTYLCYITNQGRYGKAQFQSLDQNTHAITLDFLTWALP